MARYEYKYGKYPTFSIRYGDCNIPRDYYLKINIKTNNCFKSHLDKNPKAGKFQFIKIARQNS